MNKLKWYNIRITPVEGGKSPYEFKIETSHLKQTMEKYTRDKEGNIISLWEQI